MACSLPLCVHMALLWQGRGGKEGAEFLAWEPDMANPREFKLSYLPLDHLTLPL